MRIRKLEIIGFKSFVDRTTMHFDRDVICIVGPNGCGKSNVIDALRWVMGEQSPQRLRGKAMEDVIFGGSQTRGPHSFAEVTATFDNADGLAPAEYRDYAEIAVTRRLDRSGRSDYLINKTPVRLLDVTNLFLGTGVGKRAYSVIEQGRIGYIVSSKSEDRRLMIEEAAGITKFKARKKTAERKMEQTQQNLLRVSDILREIERSLSSLKKQAQKAERYRTLKAEVRELELRVATHAYFEHLTRSRFLEQQKTQQAAEVTELETRVATLEAKTEELRIAVQEREQNVDATQRALYELDNQARLEEHALVQARERGAGLAERAELAARELESLETQQGALTEELGELRNQRSSLTAEDTRLEAALKAEVQTLDTLRSTARQAQHALDLSRRELASAEAEVARLETSVSSHDERRIEATQRLEQQRAEHEGLRTQLGELEAAELAAQQEVDAVSKQLAGIRDQREALEAQRKAALAQLKEAEHAEREAERQCARLESELASLSALDQRMDGVKSGARVLTQNQSHRALVAQRLKVPAELTQALSSALGPLLEGVLVPSPEDAQVAVDAIHKQNLAQTQLLIADTTAPDAPDAREALPALDGCLGWLADKVDLEGEVGRFVREALGQVALASDLDAALRLADELPFVKNWVSLDGATLKPGASIVVGKRKDEGAVHLLKLRQRKDKLAQELEASAAKRDDASRIRAEAQTQLEGAEEAREVGSKEGHALDLERVATEGRLRQARGELRNHTQRLERLQRELGDAEGRIGAADVAKLNAAKALEAQRARIETQQAKLGELETAQNTAQAAVEDRQAGLTQLRVQSAEAHQRLSAHQHTEERLQRSLQELTQRSDRLREEVSESARESTELKARSEAAQGTLTQLQASRTHALEKLDTERKRYDEAREALSKAEVDFRELYRGFDQRRQNLAQTEVALQEASLKLREVLSRATERHRVDLRFELNDFHHLAPPNEAELKRIVEVNRALANMGEVNLLAIDEYKEKSERHTFLKDQKDDLETALEELQRAIRQMNKESRRLFGEAFAAINERFKFVFPRMFGGGKAELKLTDPSDMLATGVDIIAQPPGKRVGALELMSGGEKALTAVSLLFSIFQYKPSPFCVLDEVDAPLDEANIARFAGAVRQMTDRSQFILISHSKRTMEHADILYGVTMEQPGISKLVAVELNALMRSTAAA